MQLMGSLDECIEIAGEVEIGGEGRYPQAGFVFEELAEVRGGGGGECGCEGGDGGEVGKTCILSL